jgi:hypothetical protein
VVCRPPYLPSRTAWQFCRDPSNSRVTVTFLRGLSSSLSPFSNCLAILPGSLDLPCCPTCFRYLSPWSVILLVPLLELPGNFAGIHRSHVLPHVFLLPFSVVCRPPFPPSRTAWLLYFAGILGPHVLPHVFLLPFSVVCRPPCLPSRTAWLFCWDPWTSRVAPRVSVTFLRGLLSSFSLFSNCLEILPGSLDLTCCQTCYCYLSPWSVVLLFPFLELPGNFAGIQDLTCSPRV